MRSGPSCGPGAMVISQACRSGTGCGSWKAIGLMARVGERQHQGAAGRSATRPRGGLRQAWGANSAHGHGASFADGSQLLRSSRPSCQRHRHAGRAGRGMIGLDHLAGPSTRWLAETTSTGCGKLGGIVEYVEARFRRRGVHVLAGRRTRRRRMIATMASSAPARSTASFYVPYAPDGLRGATVGGAGCAANCVGDRVIAPRAGPVVANRRRQDSISRRARPSTGSARPQEHGPLLRDYAPSLRRAIRRCRSGGVADGAHAPASPRQADRPRPVVRAACSRGSRAGAAHCSAVAWPTASSPAGVRSTGRRSRTSQRAAERDSNPIWIVRIDLALPARRTPPSPVFTVQTPSDLRGAGDSPATTSSTGVDRGGLKPPAKVRPAISSHRDRALAAASRRVLRSSRGDRVGIFPLKHRPTHSNASEPQRGGA